MKWWRNDSLSIWNKVVTYEELYIYYPMGPKKKVQDDDDST